MGNRVAKKVFSSLGVLQGITYYIRDAQGNVMSVYTKNPEEHLTLTEQHLYGSARLGMHTKDLDMTTTGTFNDEGIQASIRGEKSFEMSNHLGNVLSVITDQKLAVLGTTTISNFISEVVSYTDYYPFGAPMDHGASASDRSWSGYRYGFNGKEEIIEINCIQDFSNRYYSCLLGRFSSIDNLIFKYPSTTPYNFALNQVIVAEDHNGNGPRYTVYSPEQALKLKSALENGDYMEVLRILRYGSENGFVDSYGNPSDFIQKFVGQIVMPIEFDGIEKASKANVWVFELYTLNADGTYSSEIYRKEIPIEELSPNLVSEDKNWWDEWDAETEAKYQNWLREQTNSGGEKTNLPQTNNDEEIRRSLFDFGIQEPDMPESPVYGTEPDLFGNYPTPEPNCKASDIKVGDEYFAPGKHGGAYKYIKTSETTHQMVESFTSSDGKSHTNWTGNEQNWSGQKVIGK